MNKKNAPTTNDRSALDTAKFNTISAAAQRARLLAHLRHVGTLTTLQAREQLNIMHPSGRVLELRKAGYNIETVWAWDSDHEGRSHRVGRYALLSGKAVKP